MGKTDDKKHFCIFFIQVMFRFFLSNNKKIAGKTFEHTFFFWFFVLVF